jgi:hypothetical protein
LFPYHTPFSKRGKRGPTLSRCDKSQLISNGQHLPTKLLRRWGNGDREALDPLMPLVYDELPRVAARYLRDDCIYCEPSLLARAMNF